MAQTETNVYEFWTDDGVQDDIRASSLADAAKIASRKITRTEWRDGRDGAWGYVKGKDGQMAVPSR